MCRALTLLSHLGLALQSKGPVPHRQAVHNSDIPQRAVPWEHDSNACKSCWDVLTSPAPPAKEAPHQPRPIPISLVLSTDRSGKRPAWLVYVWPLSLQGPRLLLCFAHRCVPSTGDRDARHTLSQACLWVKLVCLDHQPWHMPCLRGVGPLPLSHGALSSEF